MARKIPQSPTDKRNYAELSNMPVGPKEAKHEESEDCWCEPELRYVDPHTGERVWVHREIQ